MNPQFINNTWLAVTIAGCSFVFLAVSLLISVFDERMADRTAKAAETLRRANVSLESRTTELSRSNTLLGHHVRVLELIASGVPLSETLKEITQLVEHECPEMLCSIIQLDETGTRLGRTVAPSLPKEYIAAIDNVAIGPDVGSCGAAAFRKELVIVRDIATDPNWTGYSDLALHHNLRACWSNPIVTSGGQVLGTFAMYCRQPQRGLVPPSEFIPVAEDAGLIAAIDEWVISTACAQNKAWQDKGMEAVPVAVNLSASLLRRSQLPNTVRRILAAGCGASSPRSVWRPHGWRSS